MATLSIDVTSGHLDVPTQKARLAAILNRKGKKTFTRSSVKNKRNAPVGTYTWEESLSETTLFKPMNLLHYLDEAYKDDKQRRAVFAAMSRGQRKIMGPALLVDGKIARKGKIGDNHAGLKLSAAKEGEDLMDAEHGFHDASGRALPRKLAAKRALQTKQISLDTYKRAMARVKDTGLHSQDLHP